MSELKSKNDIVKTDTRRVFCDGGGGVLGHPRVFLDMGQGDKVECKYCGRLFVLDKTI